MKLREDREGNEANYREMKRMEENAERGVEEEKAEEIKGLQE